MGRGGVIMKIKTELYNDHFQNFKRYNIPRAQLVIADIPYNLGNNAYASSNQWYVDGDNKNGESDKAGKSFFKTDEKFNLAEYMHFCSKLLKPEGKEKGKAEGKAEGINETTKNIALNLAKERWTEVEIKFDRLITPLKGSELEKEGFYSVDDQTLKSLRPRSNWAKNLIELILTRATLMKRLTAYYEGLVEL